MANDRVVGTVPPDVDNFVGRNAELAQLDALHAGARLLTVLGPPGVGKTRLAVRLAARVGARYRHGVWFVDIASMADPVLLPHGLARVLEVRPEPGQSTLDALIGHLRESEALLLLDGCEYALDACAALARALCDSCPNLHILAISRDPMNTSGDTIWRTPPLSLPAASAGRAQVAMADSVQLLVNRAREHGTQLALTRTNAAQVAEMCRSLGGLPLALELVAPYVCLQSTRQLVTHLCHGADAQHILSTTVSWAQDQLTTSQRVLLRRVSIFAGGWELTAATQVCADGHLPAHSIESDLDGLVEAALVSCDSSRGAKRYRLLDSIRGYASDALRAAGEDGSIARRFFQHVLALVERVTPEALDADHAELLAREADNIRAAISWAIGSREGEQALRLATAACSLWYFRGYYAEGCEWLLRGLRMSGPVDPLSRARAAAWLGQLLQFRGEYAEAERWLALAVQQHRTMGDPMGSAFATGMLGQLMLMRGNLRRAGALSQEASERLAQLGHPTNVASRLQLALVAIELGDLRRGSAVIADCERRVEPRTPLAAWVRLMKGRLAVASGDLELAKDHLTHGLELSRALRDQQAVLTALVELGFVHLERRAILRASFALTQAVELARQSGDRSQLVRALEGLAFTQAAEQPASAVKLASAAYRMRSTMGANAWPSERRRLASWLPGVREKLPSREYRGAWNEGRTMTTDAALALLHTVTAVVRPSIRRGGAFTARERQIIRLLARALTNDQIAAELAIRPATARTHVEHVMNKVGLHKRAELVLWASKQSSDKPHDVKS